MRSAIKTTLFSLMSVTPLVGFAAVSQEGQDKRRTDQKAEQKMPTERPGAEHQVLAPLEGVWDANVSMTMEPGQDPQTSKGSYQVRSLDGMWFVGDFKGTFEGQPFSGVQVLGYDAKKSTYVSYWFDSMVSRPFTSEGTWDAGTKTLTTKGQCPDPSGQEVTNVTTMQLKDPNTILFKIVPEGKDSPALEIEYKRKG